MYLHGTNQPLAKGSLITSAKVRKDKQSYWQSLPGHVYFVDTDYDQPAKDWACRPDNFDDAEWDEVDRQDAAASKQTLALSSAMMYGMSTATHRGVHVSSRFMGTNVTVASYGEAEDDFEASNDDIVRLKRNLQAAGEPTWWVISSDEWEAMSRADQDAYNDRCEAELNDSEVVHDLRGYWVYEVEVLGGDIEKDQHGQHHADRRVPNGTLKIVDVVIADGALLREDIELPYWKAHFPVADDEDFDRYESWYSSPVVLPTVPADIANALKGAQGGGSLCGAPKVGGSSCNRVVLAGTRCWQH